MLGIRGLKKIKKNAVKTYFIFSIFCKKEKIEESILTIYKRSFIPYALDWKFLLSPVSFPYFVGFFDD